MMLATPHLEEPSSRFRYHPIVLGALAMPVFLLSVLIWMLVPNDGSGSEGIPWFEGLRDALLIFIWTVFAIFAGGATAALALLPRRWHQAIRLVLSYLLGAATIFAIGWLWLHLGR